jgi:hypothetical protein
MASTFFNHSTNQIEIRGEVEDTELAEVAIQVGYINRFQQSLFDVIDEIQKSLPDGFRVTYEWHGKPAPENSIRIGQVKIHSGDPEYPLYIIRKQRGRPPMSGEKMVQTAIWLRRDQLEYLKSNGNLSEQVREMIDQSMKK